jgi:Toprim-like
MQKIETRRSTVYLVNESELSGLKKTGRQMRAQCPVHNSRDRDLVLVPFKSDGYLSEDEEKNAGIGYCHSDKCRATVRVIEWNPDAASRLLGHKVKAGVPRYSITDKDEEEAEKWQQRELAALNKVYDTALSALHQARCLGYLEARGLGSDEALDLLECLGVGYIPPSEDWKKTPPRELLKWCDRIVFPYTTRSGERGYIGRTLMLWTPGMDENEHKRLLNEHDVEMEEKYGLDAGKYQFQRWRKTYRSGFFNASVLGECRHIILTEGTFDAIPLMLAGLVNVVAIAGTELDVEWLRTEKRVMEVTLAFDADTVGKRSTEKTIDRINGTGITAKACTPPGDGKGKDWSERYRLAGIDGLAAVLGEFDEKLTGNPDQTAPKKNQEETCFTEHLSSTVDAQKRKTEENRGNFDLDQLAPLPSPDAPDVIPDLADTCTACGQEVAWYSDDQRPWCADHSPDSSMSKEEETQSMNRDAIVQNDPVVSELVKLFGGKLEILTADEWEARKEKTARAYRAKMINQTLQRGPVLQSLVDQWIEHGTTLIDQDRGDFWTGIEQDLEAKGYNKAFKGTEQALLYRVETPRVYASPVPRYELQEDDHGVMHLVTVGYWTEQRQEVSA